MIKKSLDKLKEDVAYFDKQFLFRKLNPFIQSKIHGV